MPILACQMIDRCLGVVTMIDEKGFVYCQDHGIKRKSHCRCRIMRRWEIDELESGRTISYGRKVGKRPAPVQAAPVAAEAAPVENPDIHVLTARFHGKYSVIGVFRYLDDAKSAAELISGGLLAWIRSSGPEGEGWTAEDQGGAVYTIDTTVVIW